MEETRVDTTDRPLAQRNARSLPFGGGCAVALGAVLLAFGAVFAVAAGLVLALAPQLREQRWLVPPAIVFVCCIGGGLLAVGIRDRRRAARSVRMAALHPGHPWRADWTWEEEGTAAESPWSRGTLLIILFVLLVMAPFNVLWTVVLDPQQDQTTRLLSLGVLIPDFFMYRVAKGVYGMVRTRLRFGRPFLRFEAFPFFLGGRLRARVTANAFAGQERVTATLRCIDERMARQWEASGGPADTVAVHQVYEARQMMPGRFAGDGLVDFALPAQPPTQLLRQPPCYWELEIAGDAATDAVCFLVPVYARPGPAPDAR